PLSSEVRHDLFLAVREILNNIAKHSEASEMWLRIHRQKDEVQITIVDNGRGFQVPAANGGNGLGNISHRLAQLGGRFEFDTQPGAGTACRLWLPLSASATPSSAK
ncbi:MAG TPA: ATP-binding protein, partial [Verrucomicrobiae bacterium]